MSVIGTKAKRLKTRVSEMVTGDKVPDFRTFATTPEEARAKRLKDAGPLEELFLNHAGRVAHKWLHYLPAYERVLAPYRGKPITFLELGVARGGSLQMWRKYFGPEATIWGVDINPECASLYDPPNHVEIGSQADPDFLRGVIERMGPPDIILDDGSHVSSHQRVSFKTLFPLLKTGGLYMIEDMHTAYWPNFEGGYRSTGSAVGLVKQLIDDMHEFYHPQGHVYAPGSQLGEIRIFDSIAVIEKVERERPQHVKIGS